MALFSKKSSTPADQEYKAAKKALNEDPLNAGKLGHQSIDSPAGQANQAAQQRVTDAKNARRR